jgi:hypothetical protein
VSLRRRGVALFGSKAVHPNRTFQTPAGEPDMIRFKTALSASALALAALGAFAQTASAQPADATPRIDQREANQQQRITQGVGSGQLNRRETYRLEKEQAAIDKTEARAKADGTVTHAERRKLTRMQNATSRDIHRQKHDAQTAKH